MKDLTLIFCIILEQNKIVTKGNVRSYKVSDLTILK